MIIRHLGIVMISEELLLGILQFHGGSIYAVDKSTEYRRICIVIEHPDMPEVEEHALIPDVQPFYNYKTGENGELLSIERTYPPSG